MTFTWFLSFVFFCFTGLALSAGYDNTLVGLLCLVNILLLLSPRLSGPSAPRERRDDVDY